ncbi:MAG TPA: hypothetical protein VMJ70_04690 [Candidatus Sulfotelmatobacter sp.]|nr:hypothetical protein [Candidatus Sulfotelmatobacter sp.]
MLDALDFWDLASRVPYLFPGRILHRAALLAAFGRRFPLAERLFESAALRYRTRLAVPALARLRAHQLIARAQACLASDRARALELAHEVETRLSRLDDLEDLAPPFALTRTRQVRERYLTEWVLPEPESKAA